MPRPVTMLPELPVFGDTRVSQPNFPAATVNAFFARGSSICLRRSSSGSTPAAAASSSMKDSTAKDVALRVDRAGKIVDARGTFRAPRRHLMPHPLDAHGIAGGYRQQHGVGARVFEPGTAVGSRVLHPHDADALGGQAQQLRVALLQ